MNKAEDDLTFTQAGFEARVPIEWKRQGLAAIKRLLADRESFDLAKRASDLSVQAAEIMEAVGLSLGLDSKAMGTPQASFILGMLLGVANGKLDEEAVARLTEKLEGSSS